MNKRVVCFFFLSIVCKHYFLWNLCMLYEEHVFFFFFNFCIRLSLQFFFFTISTLHSFSFEFLISQKITSWIFVRFDGENKVRIMMYLSFSLAKRKIHRKWERLRKRKMWIVHLFNWIWSEAQVTTCTSYQINDFLMRTKCNWSYPPAVGRNKNTKKCSEKSACTWIENRKLCVILLCADPPYIVFGRKSIRILF